MNKIIGYKVFNPDFKCRDFQFELGKTYTHEGEIELCKSGFHFCLKLSDCFSYYSFNIKNIVCEVECEEVSDEKIDDSKRVCKKITIVRQLTWYEVLNLVNTGSGNTGINNSGNFNSGKCNSGNYNSGHNNSGSCNSGYRNSGYCNSGDNNSGYRNSGSFNSGNDNSGSFNSGNYSSGMFCTDSNPYIKLFDKESTITVFQFMRGYFDYIKFCYKNQDNWNNLSILDKEYILNMPNFDKEKFEKIMGIKINQEGI